MTVTPQESVLAAAPSLDEYLDTHAPEGIGELVDGPTGFAIDTTEKALWAARKLVAYHAELAERDRVAASEHAKIEAWLDDANRPTQQAIEFFEHHLTYYHETLVREEGQPWESTKKKTVKLPGVTLQARRSQPSWIFDHEVFVSWARANELAELLSVKTEIAKTAVKEQLTVANDDGVAVTADGLVADGVTVTPGTVSYRVKMEVTS